MCPHHNTPVEVTTKGDRVFYRTHACVFQFQFSEAGTYKTCAIAAVLLLRHLRRDLASEAEKAYLLLSPCCMQQLLCPKQAIPVMKRERTC